MAKAELLEAEIEGAFVGRNWVEVEGAALGHLLENMAESAIRASLKWYEFDVSHCGAKIALRDTEVGVELLRIGIVDFAEQVFGDPVWMDRATLEGAAASFREAADYLADRLELARKIDRISEGVEDDPAKIFFLRGRSWGDRGEP